MCQILRLHKTKGEIQLITVVEELSELSQALCKFIARGEQKKHKVMVIEELADVIIMFDQLTMMLDISVEELHFMIDNKRHRLKKRIEQLKKR